MSSNNASPVLNKETLVSINKVELIDLLQHKTKLWITARLAKVADKKYIESLRKEVEDIQVEVRSRMN